MALICVGVCVHSIKDLLKVLITNLRGYIMKINWKAVFIFLTLFGGFAIFLPTIENAYEEWVYAQEMAEIRRAEEEQFMRDIEKAGVCMDALGTATLMFDDYGHVIQVLGMPKKIGTIGVLTKCSVKVRAGDMYLPTKTVELLYLVESNNGFYRILTSVAMAIMN